MSLHATGTVTGPDGTALAIISRHTEPLGPAAHDGTELVVITVAGDIDIDTTALLYAALTHAIRRHRHVCCDLSRVAFLGAAGINTLFAVLGDAGDAGCTFTVRGANVMIARVFRITGLNTVLRSRA